ncbi:LuxR C-terminal-related transcriptional regulator [Paenibacillaceae bacterium WGS1546]|uniref:LuxR C-terminal-related transcriptional regulator n=1 Tax=Cohnella sp. WGS1546 TaxID=3366810 RepID=UPI00372D6206
MDRTLTLITAPAGYGKTTLLSEWAMAADRCSAWVSLDAGDNDRVRFWAHTLAALKQACPAFDEKSVLRHATEDASGDSLIAALVNGLHRISQATALIWDDFHHIEEPAILKGVLYMIERLPAHVHLYIASRTPPSLPLSRIWVDNGLNRLEASDLRFKPEETSEFFVKCGDVKLSAEQTATIQQLTEGWAAAMRLAVLSLREHADPASLVRKMAGTERDVSDYFFEEVLSLQSDTMKHFLLRTSILERMTGELCEAVTGMAESAAYLQQLEQMSLFLVPLDERRLWYRYHHLFQQFLAAQLKIREPRQWKTLHLEAGRWLEENGYPYEAVEHYLAGTGYEKALTLLEKIAPELMVKEWTTLCAWLGAIPDSLLLAKPMMLLTKLASQYLSGQTEAATEGYWRTVRKLEEDRAALRPEDGETLRAGLAFLAAFRTFLDRDFAYAVQYSQEYVDMRPEGDFFIGFGSDADGYHPVWDIYVSDDSPRLAEQVLTALLSIWSATRNVYFVAHLSIDIGKLHYERNRLDEAETYFRQAREIGKSHRHASLATIAALWLARVSMAREDTETADAMLEELAQRTDSQASAHLSWKISSLRAVFHRMQGDPKPVKQWLRRSGLRFRDEIPLSMVKEYDLLACSLADEGKIEEAAALTERLLFIASETGRQSDRIRSLVLQSRILILQDQVAQSMDVLEEALALAWEEGYIRTFVDGGAPTARLLVQYIRLRQDQHRCPRHQVPLPYVKRLLRLFPAVRKRDGSFLQQGNKPDLTAKEQDVLRLMDAGMLNKEIAFHLNVSLSTIKTHINNIYGKLQTSNRLQALERAKTLRLF